MSFDPDGFHPLRRICQEWIGKINEGIRHREPWLEVAEECEHFFSASTGFLWDPKYKQKFWDKRDGAVQPKFKLTIARAFELVALFGPTLYWRNPQRAAVPRKALDFAWQNYAMLLDPGLQMALQQGALNPAVQEIEDLGRDLRSRLMQEYLNWTPNILKLHSHGELAITQALVAGRGCLWTMPYAPPGSDRVMVGSFFDPVENLIIDPDAETLDTAHWIAKRCIEPAWRVERDRAHLGYQPGSLQRYASMESGTAQGESHGDPLGNMHRAQGKSQDLICYWKVWSRCGAARLKGLLSEAVYDSDEDIRSRLERAAGDYVYLEVANNCPFPLNAPTDFISTATVDQVAQVLSWPVPFWKVDRWPVSALDFYARPKKPWPIAPMAPGLGELKAINILFSHMVNKLWMTMRDFIAFKKSAEEELKKVIEEGKDLSFLPVDVSNSSINEVVEFLQHPPMNRDAFEILQALLEMFDRRVGLTDLLYGLQDTQSRSATDVKIREQMTNVRPEYMASKVEEWMSQVAKAEAVATRYYVTANDVQDLFGPIGAAFWDAQITNQPEGKTLLEIDYRVEASSARRPNRDRDIGNLTAFSQQFGPIIDKYASMTGDVNPLNEMIRRWGEQAEMPVSGIYVPGPPPLPPPPPEGQPQQPQPQAA